MGWPSRFIASPDEAVYALRLMSDIPLCGLREPGACALSGATKKGGFTSTRRGDRTYPPGSSPVASVVNPAGLAISAALCLWTSGLCLATSRDNAGRQRPGLGSQRVPVDEELEARSFRDQGGVLRGEADRPLSPSPLSWKRSQLPWAPLWVAITGAPPGSSGQSRRTGENYIGIEMSALRSGPVVLRGGGRRQSPRLER